MQNSVNKQIRLDMRDEINKNIFFFNYISRIHRFDFGTL